MYLPSKNCSVKQYQVQLPAVRFVSIKLEDYNRGSKVCCWEMLKTQTRLREVVVVNARVAATRVCVCACVRALWGGAECVIL